MMLYADREGRIFDHPTLTLAGASGSTSYVARNEELIDLPEGSKLFYLPDTAPVGWDAPKGAFVESGDGSAVSALLAPGYTSDLLPAYRSRAARSTLPLWAYTAVGWEDGRFVTAACLVDDNPLWQPSSFDDRDLEARIDRRLAGSPSNRLLLHLAGCAADYHCFAAKNLFLERGEIPLPVAPVCNARCLGCISLQPSDCCPAPQERIAFVPHPAEIAELVVGHFERVPGAIASFGQGCEGEPLTQTPTLEAAIERVRSEGARGTLNLNTNGYCPMSIRRLARAGLQSVRFSLNSLVPERYEAYFRPRGYGFDDVVDAIDAALGEGLYVSLNLLFFPGVNDREEEADTAAAFVERHRLHRIQLRNLNIDPDLYRTEVPQARGERIGVRRFMAVLNEVRPDLRFGYFNVPVPLPTGASHEPAS